MQLNKNFLMAWKCLFVTEQKISATSLKPGNFYKINVYEYSDGVTKNLTGPNTAFIFYIGKFLKNGKQYAAAFKLKNNDPKLFFEYIKPMLKFNPLTDKKIDEVYSHSKGNTNDEFSKLFKKIQPDGKNIFLTLKNKSGVIESYREYIVGSIQSVAYLDVDPEYLKIKFSKESKSPKNLKLERDYFNVRKANNARKKEMPKKSGKELENLETSDNE